MEFAELVVEEPGVKQQLEAVANSDRDEKVKRLASAILDGPVDKTVIYSDSDTEISLIGRNENHTDDEKKP